MQEAGIYQDQWKALCDEPLAVDRCAERRVGIIQEPIYQYSIAITTATLLAQTWDLLDAHV